MRAHRQDRGEALLRVATFGLRAITIWAFVSILLLLGALKIVALLPSKFKFGEASYGRRKSEGS